MLERLYEKAHPRKEAKSSWIPQKTHLNQNQQRGLISQKKEEEGAHKEMNGKLKPFLSQEEMSQRRAKGLCYYCDEKYTKDHYLKHKKVQLFSLDCDEDDEFHEALEYAETEEKYEEMEQARISINDIFGITDYTTMKVRGLHGKKTLYVLNDSGSTHNFIDKKVSEMFGCKIKEA